MNLHRKARQMGLEALVNVKMINKFLDISHLYTTIEAVKKHLSTETTRFVLTLINR